MSYSYTILPPSPPCPYLHLETNFDEGLEDEGDVTQPEIFERYFEALARALPEHEKLPLVMQRRLEKLIPFVTAPDPSLRTYPYFFSRIPLSNDHPSQITFSDNIPFWVKNPQERTQSSFAFDLYLSPSASHSHHLLIKTGHSADPALPPLTPPLKTALKSHFALKQVLKQQDQAKAEQEVAFMCRWFFSTALAAEGCPLLEPLWVSSEGAWEIKPKGAPPSSFNSDGVAHLMSQLLQYEQDSNLPLLEGSWSDIKEKIVSIDSKFYFDSSPTDFQTKIEREALFQQWQQEEPLLFKKIVRPRSKRSFPDTVEAMSEKVKAYVERRRKEWITTHDLLAMLRERQPSTI